MAETGDRSDHYRHLGAAAGDRPVEHRLEGKAVEEVGAFFESAWGGGQVLDLGCGDGLFSHLFALRGGEVIGVDTEPAAIEQASIRFLQVHQLRAFKL